MVFDIGVAHKEDTDQVAAVMKDVAEGLRLDPQFGPNILEPMEIMVVNDFADSAAVVRGRIKTKPKQQWAIGREYRRRLKKAFDASGIEIPFPHTTLYCGAETEPLRVTLDAGEAIQEQRFQNVDPGALRSTGGRRQFHRKLYKGV